MITVAAGHCDVYASESRRSMADHQCNRIHLLHHDRHADDRPRQVTKAKLQSAPSSKTAPVTRSFSRAGLDAGPNPLHGLGHFRIFGAYRVLPFFWSQSGNSLTIQALASSSLWKPLTCWGTRPSCQETRTYHSEPSFDGRAVNVGFVETSAMVTSCKRLLMHAVRSPGRGPGARVRYPEGSKPRRLVSQTPTGLCCMVCGQRGEAANEASVASKCKI